MQHNEHLSHTNMSCATRYKETAKLSTLTEFKTYSFLALHYWQACQRHFFVSSSDRPVAPSLPTCDGGEYIPENTNVSCTCSTDNIGTPAGRLRWTKTGNPSIVLASGDYGRASLSVSQTLQRDDHQSTQFLCSVDWASEFLGPPVTFDVGCML